MRTEMKTFRAALRAYESGIFLSLREWYVTNYAKPVARYLVVDRPGLLRRHLQSGRHQVATMTVKRYFESLGVDELFDPGDADSLVTMQYGATNGWGSIGYQFDEITLIENGYYVAQTVPHIALPPQQHLVARRFVPTLPASTWSHGRTECLVGDGQGKSLLATHINYWQGRFTGQDGLASMAELRLPQVQERILTRVLRNNLARIKEAVCAAELNWEEVLAMTWLHANESTTCTVAGLLAAAHLCGAAAVSEFLLGGIAARNQLGTSILTFIGKFGRYGIAEEDLSAC